ncbi:MAG: PHP domain-containing protein, partial [Clostridia bacterium]|nr:PHP domain-containing protein [Clostridia bacterium]
MTIDLHLHSSASDGSDKPQEVVKKVKDNGIDVMALTDHDTVG